MAVLNYSCDDMYHLYHQWLMSQYISQYTFRDAQPIDSTIPREKIDKSMAPIPGLDFVEDMDVDEADLVEEGGCDKRLLGSF